MMNNSELERRVKNLETKIERLIRVGIVTSVESGSVRVNIKDVPSPLLKVLFPKTQDDKFQMMPDIGEQVLCIFLPFDETQGFVLGSMYSVKDPAPVSGSEKAHITFKDGTILEYDRSAKKLLLDLSGAAGEVEVKCKKAAVTSEEEALINAKNAKINVSGKTELISGAEVIVTAPVIKLGDGAEANCIHSNDPCPLGLKHIGSSIVKVAP